MRFVVGIVITLASWTMNIARVHGLAGPGDAISSTPSLSFEVGGAKLQPQDVPDWLHPYHSRSLELTESAFSDPSLTCARAVPYGPMEHQLMDIWTSSDEPPMTSTERAVVVFLHGGGWDWGYREWVGFCARNVCRDGRAIMLAPSYTLGKGRSQAWPESRDDVIEVLRWVAKNETIVANPKIILAGHSAGGHLAACVGLDRDLLETAGLDPQIVKALFLISCPLGIRAEDFFPSLSKRRWLWRFMGPMARLLYRRSVLKFLRPVVGYAEEGEEKTTKESMHSVAEDASPLFWLAASRDNYKKEGVQQQVSLPFVHYSYAMKKDFPICRPQGKSLTDILGRNKVEVFELPVEGHFESHFSLDDPSCEWHDSLRKTLSSI